MPYRGRPSAGCDTCKKRKIKCDRQDPTCENCKKAGWKCPGYPDLTTLIFHDESAKIVDKVKAAQRKNRVPSPPANGTKPWVADIRTDIVDSATRRPENACQLVTVASELPPNWDDLAVGHFIHHYVYDFRHDCSLWYVEDGNGCLVSSIKSVGIGGMTRDANGPSPSREAQQQYLNAIQLTNAALQSPDLAKLDSTLLTIMVLGIFESISGFHRSLNTWRDHINGFVDPRSMSSYGLAVFEDKIYYDLCLDNCKWFTRGWTLQELIAPDDITFFGPGWQLLGTKRSLMGTITEITKINPAVLKNRRLLSQVTIASRMSWAALRQTSRIEDRAYSLLGIFDICMPMLYGEGEKAFVRLQEEIIRKFTDQSIFAWAPDEVRHEHALLASSPDDFEACEDIFYWDTGANNSYQLSNRGLEICLPVLQRNTEHNTCYAILNCCLEYDSTGPLAICLEPTKQSPPTEDKRGDTATSEFSVRSNPHTGIRLTVVPADDLVEASCKPVTILRHPQDAKKPLGWIGNPKSPDERVLLSLRADNAGSRPWEITLLKRLSNEFHGEFQIFAPNKDNRVRSPHAHNSLLNHGHHVIHEAYTMWQVLVDPGKYQKFAVALRLSRSPGASTELRIAIIDPSDCRQKSNLLGSYELENNIHEILDSTTPAMAAVTSFPHWADIQATARREQGKHKTEIKILVSLLPPGTAARPNQLADSMPDHVQALNDLAATQHQRQLQADNQKLLKARFKTRNVETEALAAASSNEAKRETKLFPMIRGRQLVFDPSTAQQQKRRLSEVRPMGLDIVFG